MKYSEFLASCSAELNKIPETIEEEFGYLHENQFNWKPNSQSWSILECLNHLIATDSSYDATFEKIIHNHRKKFVEKEVKFSWLGKWLVNSINPNNSSKMKAPKKFQAPRNSHLKKDEVLSKYMDRLNILMKHFDSFNGLDLNNIYLSSPALWILRYNLSSCVQLLTFHHQRHIIQAMKVKRNTQFPIE